MRFFVLDSMHDLLLAALRFTLHKAKLGALQVFASHGARCKANLADGTDDNLCAAPQKKILRNDAGKV